MVFAGLKLCRINVIKEQLTQLNIKKNMKDCLFHVRVTIRECQVTTSSFKIVSSFGQLPKELQSIRYSRGYKAQQ